MDQISTVHAVVHISIEAADAQTLPALIELDDPDSPVISMSVAKFARYLQIQGNASYETISRMVISVGKLFDYYKLICSERRINPGGLRSLLEDFLAAFDRGTVLGWRAASNQQYLATRVAICDYVKFIMDAGESFWDPRELQFISACRESWISLTHAEKSLLFHTKPRSRKKAAGRKRQIVGLRQYKPFPPHLVQPLIDATKNPRDKLLFSILAYGGRRISEILHLFLQDVAVRGNELHATLKHPAQSSMTWANAAHNKITGQRREYLQAMFGRLPRTEHGALRTAVGWKGIKFDDEAECSSEIYWIRNCGQYLLQLHRDYLHGARSVVPKRNHPYYFVAEDGEPLTIKAVERQFDLACRRLDKRHGISLKGYGLHSLRHFYGFYCADILKADLLLIQKWMGHMQISSTAVYAHITPRTAASALKLAETRASQFEDHCDPSHAERALVAKSFADAGLGPLPHALTLGSTAFGQIDTAKLSRRSR